MTTVKLVRPAASPLLDVEFTSQFYDEVREKEIAKLNDLSKAATTAANLDVQSGAIQNMSVRQIFQKTRDIMVHVLEDLTAGKPLFDIFFAEERILYVGLVLITTALALYVLDVTS